MKTDLNTELVKFNGKIGPQYLDPEDKSGGLDGTMKPITLEVLQEMYMLNLPELQKVEVTNPADPVEFPVIQKVEVTNPSEPVVFPETQKVKDDLVLAKLTALETKIQTTNDKIEATNTKLNGTINTQVTGSNVGYSSDAKPGGNKGDTFLELDTKDVYFHDGTGWVLW